MTTAHPSTPSSSFELRALLRTFREHKGVIVGAVLVAVAVAVALSVTQSKRYSATATLLFNDPTQTLINPQATNATPDPARVSATNQQLLALGVIAQGTSQALHGKFTPSQVSSDVSVSSVGQADLLQVKATTASAADAAQLANAYANTYLAVQQRAVRGELDAASQRVRAQLAGGVTGAERQQLQNRLNDLVVDRSTVGSGARLVQPALVPTAAVSNHLVRNILLAVLIGLLVGALIAVILDRLSGKLKTTDEAEHLFGVPVLTAIPRTRWLEGKQVGPGMLTGVDAEPFRALRASLRYTALPDDRRSIMVVSPTPGDGKSTIARQLAGVMAATGDSVVLVEADMNVRPGPRLFGRSSRNGHGEPGLSQLLTDANPLAEENLRKALSFVRLSGNGRGGPERWLTVLPSGAPTANPSELLERDQMGQLMGWLQQHFNTVIIDSPALGVVSDAMSLLPFCSGVLIVAALGQTTRDDADQLARRLDLGDSKVIGMAVNFVPPETTRYSYARQPAGLLTRLTR